MEDKKKILLYAQLLLNLTAKSSLPALPELPPYTTPHQAQTPLAPMDYSYLPRATEQHEEQNRLIQLLLLIKVLSTTKEIVFVPWNYICTIFKRELSPSRCLKTL